MIYTYYTYTSVTLQLATSNNNIFFTLYIIRSTLTITMNLHVGMINLRLIKFDEVYSLIEL